MHMSAQIVAESCVLQLLRVVHTVSRINRDGVLRWTPNKVHFVVTARDMADGDVKVWTEMKTSACFDRFSIRSKHENNEILMQLSLDHLLSALKPAQGSSMVSVRLTKKDGLARLTLGMLLRADNAAQRSAVLDVPVAILRHDLSVEYQEPILPQPEVSIYLPSLRVLRGVIDRMKVFSKQLVLSATAKGQLTLAVDTAAVKMDISVYDLEVPDLPEAGDAPKRPQGQPVEATIDINKFSQFLFGEQIAPTNVVCSIVEQRAVIFFLVNDDVSLTYYVPVIL